MSFRIERVESCTSTMDEARTMARGGADDGTVVVAKTMTGGRGQRGTAWHAPEGGLYLSIVLRDLDDPRLLTLALGNAVADTLEIAGAEPRLKWVNDVMVDDQKIAGLLVEAESTGSDIDFLVAGIGLNVAGDTQGWPDGLADTATTLERVLGAEACSPDLEAALLDQVLFWLRRVRDGRTDEILDTWRRRDWLQGRTVEAPGEAGPVSGEAQGIDDEGRLIIDGVVVETGPVRLVD